MDKKGLFKPKKAATSGAEKLSPSQVKINALFNNLENKTESEIEKNLHEIATLFGRSNDQEKALIAFKLRENLSQMQDKGKGLRAAYETLIESVREEMETTEISSSEKAVDLTNEPWFKK